MREGRAAELCDRAGSELCGSVKGQRQKVILGICASLNPMQQEYDSVRNKCHKARIQCSAVHRAVNMCPYVCP